MRILITGGTGFIGTKLCESLQRRGHQLTVLSRKPDSVPLLCGEKVRAISQLGDLTIDEQFEAIINLAGESIVNGRWTEAKKKVLLDSRINIAEQLLDYMQTAEHKPDVFVSASAVGYYGNQNDKELSEESQAVDDFSHQLCSEWEKAAAKAEAFGIRVCIIRIGLVLGADDGFLRRMLPPFKLGLGGRLGSGKQWMSWIHITDLDRIIGLLLIDPKFKGVFNATAPHPVTNKDFTKCLASIVNRPALIPVPGKLLKILFGEMSELLLGGQKVLPKRLEEHNFVFKYEHLDNALRDVLTNSDA